jgi:hypothetical protein
VGVREPVSLLLQTFFFTHHLDIYHVSGAHSIVCCLVIPGDLLFVFRSLFSVILSLSLFVLLFVFEEAFSQQVVGFSNFTVCVLVVVLLL